MARFPRKYWLPTLIAMVGAVFIGLMWHQYLKQEAELLAKDKEVLREQIIAYEADRQREILLIVKKVCVPHLNADQGKHVVEYVDNALKANESGIKILHYFFQMEGIVDLAMNEARAKKKGDRLLALVYAINKAAFEISPLYGRDSLDHPRFARADLLKVASRFEEQKRKLDNLLNQYYKQNK